MHWRVDAVWKQRARLCATGGTFAIVRPMFGHDERLRLGQIKHLTGAMANARFRVEAHAAHRTGRRIMIDDFVGISDLSQGLAFVTLLPTRFLAGPFAQTRHPRRLLQPIARRRLAAVRTVPSEPALKFGAMGSQRRSQRNEFFSRWLCLRFGIHRILESSQIPLSRKFCTVVCGKKCSLTWPVTFFPSDGFGTAQVPSVYLRNRGRWGFIV